MTIFQVKKADIAIGDKVFPNQVIDVRRLPDGSHHIVHGGLKTPVIIDENTVTIDIGKSEGALHEGYIPGMGDKFNFAVAYLAKVEEIRLTPEEGQPALYVLGEEGVICLLERHDEDPDVFDLGRRK